jgi:two-component system sensor histidine kinase CiaH
VNGPPATDRAEARRRRASSARVALIATLVFTVVYGGVVVLLDVLVTQHLLAEVDRQLSAQLSAPGRRGATTGAGHYGLGIYGEPIEVWTVSDTGRFVSATPGAPPLPPDAWSRSGVPTSHTLASVKFRLLPRRRGNEWRIAGESVAELDHVEDVLVVAEVLAVPVLLVAVFLAALAIGLRSTAPVEEARLRQLEFTADASHELRTPISVIDAEIGVELARLGPPGEVGDDDAGARSYRAALSRLAAESRRLRRIVEDLLWLARFDAAPLPAGVEPIDLCTLASACVERFAPVAAGRSMSLIVLTPPEAVTILAPAEWVDRLAGVLVDNACRYAGEGGSVEVVVAAAGGRAVLAVEDTGPGIPVAERELLFDRFRRGTEEPGGHGLGLAIADGVVRATRGRWRIGTAAAGGARMEVSWPSA